MWDNGCGPQQTLLLDNWKGSSGALGEREERGDCKHHLAHSGARSPPRPSVHTYQSCTSSPPLAHSSPPHTHTHPASPGASSPAQHPCPTAQSGSPAPPASVPADSVLPQSLLEAHHTQGSTQTSGGSPKSAIRTMSHPTDVPTAPGLPTLKSYFLLGRQGALTSPTPPGQGACRVDPCLQEEMPLTLG